MRVCVSQNENQQNVFDVQLVSLSLSFSRLVRSLSFSFFFSLYTYLFKIQTQQSIQRKVMRAGRHRVFSSYRLVSTSNNGWCNAEWVFFFPGSWFTEHRPWWETIFSANRSEQRTTRCSFCQTLLSSRCSILSSPISIFTLDQTYYYDESKRCNPINRTGSRRSFHPQGIRLILFYPESSSIYHTECPTRLCPTDTCVSAIQQPE